ncbi:MAG: DUF1571 domain-containing protein [Planctomycetes bacterium]|nr:DUF1571 domain-containing protein [Planctomycetota bacterium]
MARTGLTTLTPNSKRRRVPVVLKICLVVLGGLFFGGWVLEGVHNSADIPGESDIPDYVPAEELLSETWMPPANFVSFNESDENSDGKPDENPAGIFTDELQGREAILRNLELLEEGSRKLESIPYYTATFYKQERVNGELCENQVVQLKLRQEPFSVYMKWLVGDTGQELLYVDGCNNDNLLVRMGGWKGRMLPALNIDPHGSTAMKKSRYPVTELGVGRLAATLIRDRRLDLQREYGYRATLSQFHKCNERDCYYFELEYTHQSLSSIYRKTVQYIDKELSLPIYIKNYTWPQCVNNVDKCQLDQSTLIEFYSYADLDLEAKLADSDFSRANTSYRFKR